MKDLLITTLVGIVIVAGSMALDEHLAQSESDRMDFCADNTVNVSGEYYAPDGC